MRQVCEAVPVKGHYDRGLLECVEDEDGVNDPLPVRVWRERVRGVQKVPQIQKVRAALGDMYLPGADPAPKTDESERAMMGWIYFAEEVALGRILFVSAESVSPCCHDHIAAPLV